LELLNHKQIHFHMKKSIVLISMFAIICMTFSITSCWNDVTSSPPSIAVTEDAGATYAGGSKVSYTIIVSSNNELKTFNVTASGATGATGTGITSTKPTDAFTTGSSTQFKNNLYTATIQYTFVLPASYAREKITFRFEVTDKDSRNDYEVTIPIGTPMTYENTSGIIYNKLYASGKSAWDLISNNALWTSDLSSSAGDMKNITTLTTASTDMDGYGFIVGWDGVNGTDFVQVSSITSSVTYANAMMETVIAAYNSGTKLSSVKHVTKGAVYIARLRGGSSYAIIEITEVYQVKKKDTTGDYFRFKYKKGNVATVK